VTAAPDMIRATALHRLGVRKSRGPATKSGRRRSATLRARFPTVARHGA